MRNGSLAREGGKKSLKRAAGGSSFPHIESCHPWRSTLSERETVFFLEGCVAKKECSSVLAY
jgi:hypothetical protein